MPADGKSEHLPPSESRAGRDDTSPGHAALPLRKKVVFSLIVTTAFFGLLELLLAACGIRPLLDEEDPYVGFSSTVPLFIEQPGPDGRSWMVTADNRLDWFNRQRFPRHKPERTFRIVCLGGSTTYGRPYDDAVSFCGWLRELLPAADRSQNWEVINAGGISYASYRVANVLEELLAYEADLFVIYSGHNEFLERRTYGDLIDTPTDSGMAAVWNRSRICSALKRVMRLSEEPGSGGGRDRSELPSDVAAVLDRAVGPDAYHRDARFTRQVLAHYRFNLERMVRKVRAAGVQVILVAPASNLKDCSPFKSQHRSDLEEAEHHNWQALFEQAEQAYQNGRFEQALQKLDQAEPIDNHHAGLHYLRGHVLLGLSRPAEARTAFIRARDEDVCPLRALSSMREIVREVAAHERVPCVDFVAIVEKHAQQGIPGSDLFLDHVHPTIAGNRLLALSLLEAMMAAGMLQPDSEWGEKAIESVVANVESRLDQRDHARALRNLSKVLGWAGKTDEANRLALQAVRLVPDDAETFYQAGNAYFDQGELDQAEAHFREALKRNPNSASYHYGVGLVLDKRGQLRQAVTHYQRAVQLDPDFVHARYSLGLAQERLGNMELAELHYRHAARLDPDHADTHNNLGVVLARRGKLDAAAEQFRRALQLDPNSPRAHTNLGRVFAERGDLHQAVSHYRSAVQQHPAPTDVAIQLAWILATTRDAQLRNGSEAVRWAKYCAKATDYADPEILSTLAAAYAEDGNFPEAVRWQSRALELARPMARSRYQTRLELYRKQQPYRQPSQ